MPIARGTTDKITVLLPFEVSGAKEAKLYIMQDCETVLVKDINSPDGDMFINGSKVECYLSQKDTLALNPCKIGYAQFRVKMPDEDAFTTNIVGFNVENAFGEVI